MTRIKGYFEAGSLIFALPQEVSQSMMRQTPACAMALDLWTPAPPATANPAAASKLPCRLHLQTPLQKVPGISRLSPLLPLRLSYLLL